MDCLPNEIIEHILKDPVLSIQDVVNFSSTTFKFRQIVNSSSPIWKSKYCQRWPYTDKSVKVTDWFNECVRRKNFESKARELLSNMSSMFYHYNIKNIGSSQLNFVVDFVDSEEYGYYYLRDFLKEIISLPLSQSLTDKYYSTILLKFINKRFYTQFWQNMLQLHPKYQTLEKGAIFLSLWCQDSTTDITSLVTSDLNQTAELAKQHLLQEFQNHPLKDVPADVQLQWREENISDNYFEPSHCMSIIESINYILFDHLKYCIAYDLSGTDKRKGGIDNAVIDRKAAPLIFAVIYESVARRLGVLIEVLEFSDHCLLKWRESYSVPDAPFHYISTSNKGLFMKSRCPMRSGNSNIPSCDMEQIAQKAAYNVYPLERGGNHLLMRDALELSLVIHPFSLEWYQQLSRYYMLHDMDVRELAGKLLSLKNQMSNAEWGWCLHLFRSLETYQKTWEKEQNLKKTTEVHHRDEEVVFAVGMIVRDKAFGKVGVIYGWHRASEPPDWEEVNTTQPFYKILTGDGKSQYVPQDSLRILHSPPFVYNPFIGRYFEEYCTTHYKPNKQLQAEYPEDMEALEKILKRDREV